MKTISIRSLVLALAAIATPVLAVAAEASKTPSDQPVPQAPCTCSCLRGQAPGQASKDQGPKWDPMVDSVKP